MEILLGVALIILIILLEIIVASVFGVPKRTFDLLDKSIEGEYNKGMIHFYSNNKIFYIAKTPFSLLSKYYIADLQYDTTPILRWTKLHYEIKNKYKELKIG